MLHHLGLRAPTASEEGAIRAIESADELARVEREHGKPPEAVLKPVRHFYLPFNRALAYQLADEGFLWRPRSRLDALAHFS